MAKMFSKGFKPKSTTKVAKNIIRSEIKSYYTDKQFGNSKDWLKGMNIDANNYNCGDSDKRRYSDYQKGAGLVDAGCFACYYNDQRKMLGKIYGKQNVDSWPNNKVHNTYKHLIGREYNSMLIERKK